MTDKEIIEEMRKSPLLFIKVMWHLTPQRIKPEYAMQFTIGKLLTGKEWDKFCADVHGYWFQPFREGQEITWQQLLLFLSVEKALRGEVPRRISVVSGRGTGKSSSVSMIVLWFLFCFKSLITATGPTEKNLLTILWPEIARWMQKMPIGVKEQYEWQATFVRMKISPMTWFARAVTASKEAPESISGAHDQNQVLIADEASGIESNAIFDAASGSLTNSNYLFILISQGLRPLGYFYDSHKNPRVSQMWTNLSFNSEESPIVKQGFIESVETQYGKDSTEYRIQVKGQFPEEGVLEDGGWTTLFNESDLHFIPYDPKWEPVGRAIMSLDPAGEGQDTAEFCVRDRLVAAIVHTEKTSNSKSLASTGVTLAEKFFVDAYDWIVDAFGVGHDVGTEVALVTARHKRPWRVFAMNTGEVCDDADDRELYINKRAEGFYKARAWCRSGGQIMDIEGFKEELLSIRMKRTTGGKIQIMGKVEMRKLGIKSPNKADAFSMTFLRSDSGPQKQQGDDIPDFQVTGFDPHDPLGD